MNRAFMILMLLVSCTGGGERPPIANGTLDPWQAATPLPTARANHCSAVIDDWVLVIGGNRKQGDAFVKTDEIHTGQIEPDGTISAWQLAGRLPSPVSECNATSDGKNLYVIDGLYDTQTDARKIFTAALDPTGHLAPLVTMGGLPDKVIAISSEATVHHG